MIQDAMWDSWLNGDDASEESKKIVNEMDNWVVVPVGEEERDRNVKVVCEKCGDDQVVADASAGWDISLQEWVMTNVSDTTVCGKCQDFCSILEVECNEDGEEVA